MTTFDRPEQLPSDLDLAYLAGVFDGEGYAGIVNLKRKSYPHDKRSEKPTAYPVVRVGMYDTGPVQSFAKAFGGHCKEYGPYLKGRKASWIWYAQYRRAFFVALQLHPWCRNEAKRAQLQLIIDHYTVSQTGRLKRRQQAIKDMPSADG